MQTSNCTNPHFYGGAETNFSERLPGLKSNQYGICLKMDEPQNEYSGKPEEQDAFADKFTKRLDRLKEERESMQDRDARSPAYARSNGLPMTRTKSSPHTVNGELRVQYNRDLVGAPIRTKSVVSRIRDSLIPPRTPDLSVKSEFACLESDSNNNTTGPLPLKPDSVAARLPTISALAPSAFKCQSASRAASPGPGQRNAAPSFLMPCSSPGPHGQSGPILSNSSASSASPPLELSGAVSVAARHSSASPALVVSSGDCVSLPSLLSLGKPTLTGELLELKASSAMLTPISQHSDFLVSSGMHSQAGNSFFQHEPQMTTANGGLLHEMMSGGEVPAPPSLQTIFSTQAMPGQGMFQPIGQMFQHINGQYMVSGASSMPLSQQPPLQSAFCEQQGQPPLGSELFGGAGHLMPQLCPLPGGAGFGPGAMLDGSSACSLSAAEQQQTPKAKKSSGAAKKRTPSSSKAPRGAKLLNLTQGEAEDGQPPADCKGDRRAASNSTVLAAQALVSGCERVTADGSDPDPQTKAGAKASATATKGRPRKPDLYREPRADKDHSMASFDESDPDDLSTSGLNVSPSLLSDPERMRIEKKRARNRVAARRCRERKLSLIQSLEHEVENQRDQVDRLRSVLEQYRSVVAQSVDKLRQACEHNPTLSQELSGLPLLSMDMSEFSVSPPQQQQQQTRSGLDQL